MINKLKSTHCSRSNLLCSNYSSNNLRINWNNKLKLLIFLDKNLCNILLQAHKEYQINPDKMKNCKKFQMKSQFVLGERVQIMILSQQTQSNMWLQPQKIRVQNNKTSNCNILYIKTVKKCLVKSKWQTYPNKQVQICK